MSLTTRVLAATLYVAISLTANMAFAGPDISALEALREGTMKKLAFHSQPQDVSAKPFTDPDGQEHHLADYAGKYVLVNFWATWCAPCRKEMPALDALQQQLGGEKFQVVTIAVGRNPIPAIDAFFEEAGITDLPKYRDPKQILGREMGVLGLPISVILDPEGQEIARLQGDAEWAAPSAIAIFDALISAQGDS